MRSPSRNCGVALTSRRARLPLERRPASRIALSVTSDRQSDGGTAAQSICASPLLNCSTGASLDVAGAAVCAAGCDGGCPAAPLGGTGGATGGWAPGNDGRGTQGSPGNGQFAQLPEPGAGPEAGVVDGGVCTVRLGAAAVACSSFHSAASFFPFAWSAGPTSRSNCGFTSVARVPQTPLLSAARTSHL